MVLGDLISYGRVFRLPVQHKKMTFDQASVCVQWKYREWKYQKMSEVGPLTVVLPQIFFSLTTLFSYLVFFCLFHSHLDVVHFLLFLRSFRFESSFSVLSFCGTDQEFLQWPRVSSSDDGHRIFPVMGEIACINMALLGRYLHGSETRARWVEGLHNELSGHMFDLERDGCHQGVLCP